MVGPGKNKKMIAYATYCSAQKNYSKKPVPAIELYDSDRISKVFELAKIQNVKFVILSGKHGLLEPNQEINYYDHLLIQSEVETHANVIATQITSKYIREIVFFTNSVESEPNLLPYIACIDSACEKAKIQLRILVAPKKDLMV
jgi:hypothetical protein